jgi:hypothetical protein
MTTTTTPQGRKRSKNRSNAEREERRNAARALALQLRGELQEGKHEQTLARVKKDSRLQGLQRYSELNQLMILRQCPTATEVHGYVEWQTLGKQVPEGVAGIAIRAPHDITKKGAAATDGQENGGDGGKKVGIHITYVWDISQVIKKDEAKTKTTTEPQKDDQRSPQQQEEKQPSQEEEAALMSTADESL